MANKIFQDILKNDINNLVNESKAINDVQHNGLKGSIREYGIGKIIGKYIPQDFAIGSGQIHDYNGNQSKETDLIIYNRHILPPIMFGEHTGFFPVESCIYSIESKTTSNATEIQTTIVKFETLKSLQRLSNNKPVRVYFAFSSDLSESSELERYKKYDPHFLTDPAINVICVLGQGYWYYDYFQHENGQIFGIWHYIEPENFYEFGFLLSGIVNTLNSINNFPRFGFYLLDESSPSKQLYCTRLK